MRRFTRQRLGRCHQFQAADAVRVAEFQPENCLIFCFQTILLLAFAIGTVGPAGLHRANAGQSGELPKDDGWIYEAKLNSYRCPVPRRKGGPRLVQAEHDLYSPISVDRPYL
jgi:hypothetical protein